MPADDLPSALPADDAAAESIPTVHPAGAARPRSRATKAGNSAPVCLRISLHTTRLAVHFRTCTPIVEIDGEEFRSSWGNHSFDVPAGRRKVRVWFPYIGKPQCGLAELVFEADAGDTVRLEYSMPPFMFASGTLMEVPS
jgi:hypothetical protein